MFKSSTPDSAVFMISLGAHGHCHSTRNVIINYYFGLIVHFHVTVAECMSTWWLPLTVGLISQPLWLLVCWLGVSETQ